ncbi:hypothetical protein BN2497_6595 [Janthinobacterium sp. CG23_2]|nr:hypothetical protein BN2497_6595 [Janthinobacterium sp. CG23_2]CUU29695.1 hypothetical protein BN3177_6595 [Janthinobacterium sp. CG23_2]
MAAPVGCLNCINGMHTLKKYYHEEAARNAECRIMFTVNIYINQWLTAILYLLSMSR